MSASPTPHAPACPPGQHTQLVQLAGRIARLNPDSATIGAGMLASLVADARRALGKADAGAEGCAHVCTAQGTPCAAANPAAGFADLPLATCPLSLEERARWINVLDPLLRYAGRPGDWGRESKLGLLTMRLMQVRAELSDASTLPREGDAA